MELVSRICKALVRLPFQETSEAFHGCFIIPI